jgi:hypothetical protein
MGLLNEYEVEVVLRMRVSGSSEMDAVKQAEFEIEEALDSEWRKVPKHTGRVRRVTEYQ